MSNIIDLKLFELVEKIKKKNFHPKKLLKHLSIGHKNPEN